jgi:hypothetical protein
MSPTRPITPLRRASLQLLLLMACESVPLQAPAADARAHSCAQSISEVASPVYAWNTPQQKSAWLSCLESSMICALIRHDDEGKVPSVRSGQLTSDMPGTDFAEGGPSYVIFIARSLVSAHGHSCFFAQFQSASAGWVVHKWQVSATGEVVDLPAEVSRSVRHNEWASPRSLAAMLWNMFAEPHQAHGSS